MIQENNINENLKCYFIKIEKILKTFQNVMEQHYKNFNTNSLEYQLIKHSLINLDNSFEALKYKYLFDEKLNYRLPSEFVIEKNGLPFFKIFYEMFSDQNKDKTLVEEFNYDKTSLKNDMFEYILKYKKISKDLQFIMSLKKYYDILFSKEIFFKNSYYQKINENQYIMSWEHYDSQYNLPLIYIMYFEYTKTINEEILKELQEYCLNNSQSEFKLITIANNIDKKFNHIHPKNIKKITIGPIFSNLFSNNVDKKTYHNIIDNKNIEAINQWFYNFDMEIIISEKQIEENVGLFTKIPREVFMINHYDQEKVEKGISQIEKFTIFPYEIYQNYLNQSVENNNFIDRNIYICDDDYNIITY